VLKIFSWTELRIVCIFYLININTKDNKFESKDFSRWCINPQNYWVSGLCPSSGTLNIINSKLDLFPSSGDGREKPTLLDPLEKLTSMTGQN
jgi:hypothetical protein